LKFFYLAVGRLILGFTIGISNSIVPVYLNSIAPLQISGLVGSINQLMIGLGVIGAYSFGYLIEDDPTD
jgi:MFS family permease